MTAGARPGRHHRWVFWNPANQFGCLERRGDGVNRMEGVLPQAALELILLRFPSPKIALFHFIPKTAGCLVNGFLGVLGDVVSVNTSFRSILLLSKLSVWECFVFGNPK